jgi:hypothetical protein
MDGCEVPVPTVASEADAVLVTIAEHPEGRYRVVDDERLEWEEGDE